jgi:hypothetical protein
LNFHRLFAPKPIPHRFADIDPELFAPGVFQFSELAFADRAELAK